MPQHILLITDETALAERLHRALSLGVGAELIRAPGFVPAPDWRGWALVLIDGRWVQAAAERAAKLAPVPAAVRTIWLGPPPLSAAAQAWSPAADILDYVKPDEPISKLAFVLRQHLLEAFLHRIRHPQAALPAPVPDARALAEEMNNALTGILGNAQLALDAGARLPTHLRQRLHRIEQLATRMRDQLALQPPLPGAATGLSLPRAA